MERKITLAEIRDELSAARTNKREFLNKLDAIIPWKHLQKSELLQRRAQNQTVPTGIDAEDIHITEHVQSCVMYEVIDSHAFSDFCGVNSPKEVPNGGQMEDSVIF